jgi:hypothetical protein
MTHHISNPDNFRAYNPNQEGRRERSGKISAYGAGRKAKGRDNNCLISFIGSIGFIGLNN